MIKFYWPDKRTMHISKETKITDSICLALFICTGFVRLYSDALPLNISRNLVINLFFTASIIIWGIQAFRRIYLKEARLYIQIVSCLLLFWINIRTLKYVFFVSPFLLRTSWYLYYLPMIFIPQFVFLIVLCIGSKEVSNINSRIKCLHFISLILFLLVLTNDKHQKAFLFIRGLNHTEDADVRYGIIYFIIIAYIVIITLATLVIAFLKCKVERNRSYLLVPCVPVFIGLFFCYTSVMHINTYLVPFTAPEIGCMIYIIFIESLILTRLIPSNDYYKELFEYSSSRIIITDNSAEIKYGSIADLLENDEDIKDKLIKGRYEPVYLDENTVLRCNKIKAGYVYWLKDITELNTLNSNLKSFGDLLAEETELLAAETRMKENMFGIKMKTRLYQHIETCLKPKFDQLDALLKAMPEDESAFRHQMKKACIYNSYIKRCSNLLIISKNTDYITGNELKHAFSESLEYIKLFGLEAFIDWKLNGGLHIKNGMLIYEVFEDVVEAYCENSTAIITKIYGEHGTIGLKMQIDTEFTDEFLNKVEAKTRLLNSSLEAHYDRYEGEQYLALELYERGGRHDNFA